MDYFSHEHIDPFDPQNPDFWMKIEHLGRYLYGAYILNRQPSPQHNHLDIGCCNGYGLNELAAKGRSLYGIDYNKESIKKASCVYPKANFIQADLDTQKLKDLVTAPARSATAFEVLEHLDNPADLLQQLAKLLPKGGKLLCSFPNPSFERIDKDGQSDNPYHHHIFTLEQSTALLEKAGFVVEEVLGQALCNQVFSSERNLYQSGKIPEKPFSRPSLNDAETINTMANIFAWPSTDNLKNSYTFIFVARKA